MHNSSTAGGAVPAEGELPPGQVIPADEAASSAAVVQFTRVRGTVVMSLLVDGTVEVESNNYAFIARAVHVRGIRRLSLSDAFVTDVPTNSATLLAAARHSFAEPYAVYALISECAWELSPGEGGAARDGSRDGA